MSDLPIFLIEGILVFGGAMAFALWQIRDVNKRQEERRRREGEQADAQD